MALQQYKHPFQYGIENPLKVDFNTYAIRQKLPAWRVCQDPKPPFVLNGQENWNCARCAGEPDFMLPIETGDSFEYLFQFDDEVNTDVTNPNFGWRESGTGADEFYMRARMVNCDCSELAGFTFVDQFCSDWGVGWNEVGGSFQWLKVDWGLLPTEVCCFTLQVEKYVLVEGLPVLDQTITAGPFWRNDSTACEMCAKETILLCGTWKKTDCWGRRYDVGFGANGTTFTDCVRLPGNVVFLGMGTESVFDGDIETKTNVRRKYRLELAGVPPMIAEWVATILGSNNTLSIGGYEINRAKGDTVGSFDRGVEGVEMFYGNVEFSQLCEIQNFEC